MQKKLSVVVTSLVLLSLSACSLFPEKGNESKNWSVTKLYAEAREEMKGGQYEVHVAKYYYRRGAFLAALNRAEGAVTDYRDAPASEEALFLMIRCYDKMGNLELRDDTQRVFVKNYPKSKYLDPNASERSWL